MNYKIGGFRFGKIKPLILYKWFYLCITSEKKQIVIFKQRGGETMSTTKALLKENVWYVMFAIVFALVLILPGMVSAEVGDTCAEIADCDFGESCSNLNTLCAECQSCCNSSSVCNSTSGNHRNVDRIN